MTWSGCSTRMVGTRRATVIDQHHPLAEVWRARAANLAAWALADAARVWQLAADELDQHERECALQTLTLAEAAEASGYSQSHLGRMVAEGKIENAGERGSPRVRRGDLPRRAPARRAVHGEPDLVGKVFGSQE